MTKHKYVVEYWDGPESGFPISLWFTRASCLEEALDRFNDSDEAFEPLRAARVPEGKPRHRWNWVLV